MRLACTYIILFLLHSGVFSQQLAQHQFYYVNENMVNPAATALGKCKTFSISDKHQWLGIENAPSIQYLGVVWPRQVSKYKKYGLGLNLVHDKNGATRQSDCEMIYSYHFQIGTIHRHMLSFGLSANIAQNVFDESEFNPYINDPLISYGTSTELTYNAAFGVYLYGEKYNLGLGLYNLLPVSGAFYRQYANSRFFSTLSAGYLYSPFMRHFTLKTTALFCIGDEILMADLNNRLSFENLFSFGLTLRKYMGNFPMSGQNVILLFGYDTQKLAIIYSFDYGINSYSLHHYGTHGITLMYRICPEKYACPTYNQ